MPLILGPGWKTTCVVLQVVPVPGVGAIIAGVRNPHSGLLGRGIAQAMLVVFGSWPLIIPGALGLGWAIWDATRIAHAQPAPPWSQPTPDADPDTLDARSPRAQQRALLRQERQAARRLKRERQAQEAHEDETRWMP